jgi:alkylhydroperoxidase/carboxymuconolactone decarboxylase family protein YurZ
MAGATGPRRAAAEDPRNHESRDAVGAEPPAWFELHLRAALRNASPEGGQGNLLHVAAYCGAPAALDSFRIARKVLAEQSRAAKNRKS